VLKFSTNERQELLRPLLHLLLFVGVDRSWALFFAGVSVVICRNCSLLIEVVSVGHYYLLSCYLPHLDINCRRLPQLVAVNWRPLSCYLPQFRHLSSHWPSSCPEWNSSLGPWCRRFCRPSAPWSQVAPGNTCVQI
jgi:hypothetical protein